MKVQKKSIRTGNNMKITKTMKTGDNMKNDKKGYMTPRMEVSWLEKADIITTSIEAKLTGRSIKQSQVDNQVAKPDVARWDTANNPIDSYIESYNEISGDLGKAGESIHE